ncbi:MAG: hypothetical protein M0Q38_06340 [Bacteroidales bacterium]|jgi:uncharacterized low-complexity protein|nr:hypothetical protein [Bacteroidales bacterium]
MKTSNSNVFKGSLIAGAFITIAGLSSTASNLVSYNRLGSGSEIRANLIESASSAVNFRTLELKCGDSTAMKKPTDKTKDAKNGINQKDTKKAGATTGASKDGKKTEGKSKDGKCGEGKCGNK